MHTNIFAYGRDEQKLHGKLHVKKDKPKNCTKRPTQEIKVQTLHKKIATYDSEEQYFADCWQSTRDFS